MRAAIDQIIATAIERAIFPGAVVLLARNGVVCHYAAYGSTMYADAGSQPVARDTIYDVASLTKVFTATAALRLLEAGLLDLDAPVARYLPELRATNIMLRHLLTHSSGLELRLSQLRDRPAADIRAAIYAAMPLRPPGSFMAYTNINSLLLGDVVARVTGQPLDTAIATLVLAPLGLRETCFCPAAALHPRIAPSEWDHEWRGELVWGQVHDESAAALGGVAGHAGLFSTAWDIWRFGQCWLDMGRAGGQQVLHPQTVALATRNYTANLAAADPSARGSGLGWMLERPIFMGDAPLETYGHTGFTGPVLVLVPSAALVLVILSNRCYPRRCPPPYPHHAVTAAVLRVALQQSDNSPML